MGPILGLSVVLGAVIAWLTHVIVCIKSASWVLLVIGTIIFPISIVHGVGSWFGLF